MTTERRVEETGTASFPASSSSPYTLPPLAYGYADLDPVRSAVRIVLEHGGTVWFRAASKSLPVRELSVRLRSLLCSRVV